MSDSVIVLEQGATQWRLFNRQQTRLIDHGVTTDQLVVEVQEFCATYGHKSRRLVLAIDSESCFFVALDDVSARDVRSAPALNYRFEAHLPIDAEQFVASTMSRPMGERKFRVTGVVTETELWRPLLKQLCDGEFLVAGIVPRTVLAARECLLSADSETPCQLVIETEIGYEWVSGSAQGLYDWKCFRSADALVQHLARTESCKVDIFVGSEANAGRQLDAALALDETAIVDLDDAILKGADQVATEQWGNWYDLRRGELGALSQRNAGQRPIIFAAVALTCLLLAIAIGGWWRSRILEKEVMEVRSAQVELFRQVFPAAPVPAALMSRVRSEHSRMTHSRTDAPSEHGPDSATDVMQRLVTGLPQQMRFRITRIEVRGAEVEVDVQVRSPQEIGEFATALSDHGFEVDPPGIDQVDAQTYQTTINARWSEPNATS